MTNTILSYIEATNLYHLETKITHEFKKVVDIYKFMKKYPCPKKLTNYLKFNNTPDIFYLLLNIIPFPLLINWYYEVSVLQYYWNDKIINQLVNNNLKQNEIYFWNKEYDLGLQNLIVLNNQYNLKYNFTEKVLNKRYEKISAELKNELDMYLSEFNLENSFFGEDFIKSLGLGLTPLQITIYFEDTIKFKKETLVKYKYPYYFLETKNYIFKIYQYKKNFNQLILLGITNALIDNKLQIYSNAKFYQSLSNSSILTDNIKDLPLVKLYNLRFNENTKVSDSNIPRCYICKKCFDHEIYIEEYFNLCLDCAIENYTNANLKVDLTNKSFLITGGRTKIGFATALKLLRMGSKVVITTRYPHFAMKNYQNEKDYESWKNNLIIIKCDFTKLDEIYSMLNILENHTFNGIINNACQTIKASEYYYETAKKIEDGLESTMIENNNDILENQIVIYNKKKDITILNNTIYNEQQLIKFSLNTKTNDFKDIQDIPHINSWEQTIDEITPQEIVECTLINQVVPTLIINKLKPKLVSPKFIINVTSLEGTFNHAKTNKHPHTNMCKSAMNMLIRTLSEDTDKDLHVYAINPGYVSGVCPQQSRYAISLNDGASRIIYPIVRLFMGFPLTKDFVVMHNYKPCSW